MQPSPRTNAQLRARMEELLGEYEQLKRNLGDAQRRSRAMTGTAATTDSTVVVRVDAQGRPSGLEIDPKAYRRYSPSQLAADILRLYREAGRDVASRIGEVMAPFLPEGLSYERVASGEADPSEWMAPQPLTDETFDDWRARFSGRPDVRPPEDGY